MKQFEKQHEILPNILFFTEQEDLDPKFIKEAKKKRKKIVLITTEHKKTKKFHSQILTNNIYDALNVVNFISLFVFNPTLTCFDSNDLENFFKTNKIIRYEKLIFNPFKELNIVTETIKSLNKNSEVFLFIEFPEKMDINLHYFLEKIIKPIEKHSKSVEYVIRSSKEYNKTHKDDITMILLYSSNFENL